MTGRIVRGSLVVRARFIWARVIWGAGLVLLAPRSVAIVIAARRLRRVHKTPPLHVGLLLMLSDCGVGERIEARTAPPPPPRRALGPSADRRTLPGEASRSSNDLNALLAHRDSRVREGGRRRATRALD